VMLPVLCLSYAFAGRGTPSQPHRAKMTVAQRAGCGTFGSAKVVEGRIYHFYRKFCLCSTVCSSLGC
jgi:hypothetical protein